MKIALLGAARTGKSTLARQLADRLREQGRTAAIVPECMGAAGEPAREDLLSIARDHERHVTETAADVVIADTTALMVAMRSGAHAPDDPLLRFALERQRAYDATLVTGLDVGVDHDLPSRQREDELVRAVLASAGMPFRVVYGSGDDRLRNALAALPDSVAVRPALPQRAWSWQCEKCSDPECEHRLFTSLTR